MKLHRSPLLLASLATTATALAAPLSPGFTYQGQLQQGGAPANGTFDLRLTLHDALNGGAQVSGPTTNAAVAVANGVFTTQINFGTNPFTGDARWIEIAVRPAGGGAFVPLNPRQAITATPYALHALNPGPKGDKGDRGDTGLQGPIGLTGPQGSPGINGTNGAAGPRGAEGPRGLAGANGTNGAPGIQGPKGDKGDRGDAGPQGPIGLTGPQGLPGINGTNGAAGPRGAEGPRGLAGANGTNGAPGAQGIPGVAGPKGDKGDRGDVGPRGPQGDPGPQGPAGSADGWSRSGNAGTSTNNFLGTIDAQALNLAVNSERALRLEPRPNGAPNLIGGSLNNSIASTAEGSVIAGGGTAEFPNRVEGSYAVIGGGTFGINRSSWGVIAGGRDNTIDAGESSAIGGGWVNVIGNDSSYSTVAGGYDNSIGTNSLSSVISGGFDNRIGPFAEFATIPGGGQNTVAGRGSLAAGIFANAQHPGSFVWNDGQSVLTSAGTNTFNVGARGGAYFETGGRGLFIDGAPLLGFNAANRLAFPNDQASLIFPVVTSPTPAPMIYMFDGGISNADRMVIAHSPAFSNWGLRYADNGDRFQFMRDGEVVGTMDLSNRRFFMGSGSEEPFGQLGIVAGQAVVDLITTNSPNGSVLRLRNKNATGSENLGAINFDVSSGTPGQIGYRTDDQMLFRVGYQTSMTLAPAQMTLSPTVIDFGTLTRQMLNLWGGGVYGIGVQSNTQYYRTDPSTDAGFAWYSGGSHNEAQGDPGGGTTLMELRREVLRTIAPIAIERGPFSSNRPELHIRDFGNTSGNWANIRLAAGNPVTASWDLRVRAGGSVGPGALEISPREDLASNGSTIQIFDSSPTSSGMILKGDLFLSGTVIPVSDRNQKRDIHPLNAREVLDKLAALSIQSWAYTNSPARRHIGPMAQDFHAAFGLNGDHDTGIATVDADGVALAAIQGLNQKLEASEADKDARIRHLEAELAELKELLRSKSTGR
jgi:hypothetical protein